MKFIPRDHKIARLWVDACSSSLSIEKQEAASMYANLCGFKTWDAIIKAIGKAKPSPVDEDCGSDVVAERKAFYQEVLVNVFTMNPLYATYLVDTLSPSSGKVPKRFSFDHESMHDELREGVMPLMPPGMTMETLRDGMESFIEMLADKIPSLEGIDTTNLMERMRISGPIDPADYYNFCSTMGWEIIEESYAEEYEHGKPLFCLNSSFGDVLVYANSLSKVPGDHDDEMAEHLHELVLDDARQGTDFPAVILFAGKFMTKDYRGKKFTCGGSLYKDGEWYDFLVNRDMDTVDKLFEAAEADVDLNNPDERYADDKNIAIGSFLAVSYGLSSLKEVFSHRIMTVGSPSGWGAVMLGEKR